MSARFVLVVEVHARARREFRPVAGRLVGADVETPVDVEGPGNGVDVVVAAVSAPHDPLLSSWTLQGRPYRPTRRSAFRPWWLVEFLFFLFAAALPWLPIRASDLVKWVLCSL